MLCGEVTWNIIHICIFTALVPMDVGDPRLFELGVVSLICGIVSLLSTDFMIFVISYY